MTKKRPKACRTCRRTKTKCDFGVPCSRCTARKTLCSYSNNDNTLAVTANNYSADTQTRAVSLDGLFQTPTLAPGVAPMEILAQAEGNFSNSIWTFQTPSLMNSTVAHRPVPAVTQDLQFTAANLGLWSQCYISVSCRQFVISVTRSFPRMMTRPHTLPPFVHRVGCGLEHVSQETKQTDPQIFAPLKPLAACVSMSHMFAAGMPNSDQFLWQTMDAEHKRIRNEVSGSTVHCNTTQPLCSVSLT